MLVIALAVWTCWATSDQTVSGQQTIVFWGAQMMGDEIYSAVHQFETLPENIDPKTGKSKYKVILGMPTSPDMTGDAQRLLCAIAGGVPPDVVWFDRFAIGEWAARGALADLNPYLRAQSSSEKYRLNLDEFYSWAVAETSYRPPGSHDRPGVFGIPTAVDLRVLYSNANYLRQEGLIDPKTKSPRAPKTWAELRIDANALTRFKRAGDKSSGISRLGFAPNLGDSWLYIYAFQAGGELMNADRTRITLDSPPVVRALHFMTDVYDDLGGFKQVEAYRTQFQDGDLDPFVRGDVAMKIDGIWFLDTLADWKRDMDFLVTAAPMPADRLAAGAAPITWGGGFSLVIPSTAHNKDGAWKLIQFLSSKQNMLKMEEDRREQKESQGRLYLPRAMSNRLVFEELCRRHIDNNPDVPKSFQDAFAVIKQMLPNTKFRPVTPVGQMLWNQHKTAYENAVHHVFASRAKAENTDEIRLALADAQAPVQRALDEILEPLPDSAIVNWSPLVWSYLAIVLIAVAWILSRRRGDLATAMLFTSPWLIGMIVFVGGPILFSIVFAFTRYDVLAPAHWVGLANFRALFRDDLFYKSLGNTAYMMMRVPLTMALSLAIALVLNTGVRGMGFYRTAAYMPAIVPTVAAALLWIFIFNPTQGLLNQSLAWLFDALHLHVQPPLWLQDEKWSKPSLILMNLWGAGGGIIIWLAGLQSIPQQLYEAASIDGAGKWRRFWHVTVPMLSPYILFNFIIGAIGTMQIFNEAFVMTHGGPSDSTLFYAYHLFREAFQYFRMGYASALAWILFLIVLALTLLQLWLARKWVHYEQA